MGKIVLYLAVSLDGYIADTEGGVAWLGGEDGSYQGDYGYTAFWEQVGAVVMGARTYRQIRRELSPDTWPYAGKAVYVLSHREEEEAPPAQVSFVSGPAEELLKKLRGTTEGDIWICGGADVVEQCFYEIDVFCLSTMPVLLGSGIPLFRPGRERLPLSLVDLKQENGVIISTYQKI